MGLFNNFIDLFISTDFWLGFMFCLIWISAFIIVKKPFGDKYLKEKIKGLGHKLDDTEIERNTVSAERDSLIGLCKTLKKRLRNANTLLASRAKNNEELGKTIIA